MVQPKYHMFICTSCRLNGQIRGFCAGKGAIDLLQLMAEEVDENDLSSDVMLTHTGCFGICDKGPIMVVYPEGVWYGDLSEDDIPEIVEKHLAGGEPVKEKMI